MRCKLFVVYRLLFVGLLLGINCNTLFAVTLPKDSTKPKKPTTLNDTWYLGSEPETRHVIDTSIYNIEQYSPVQNDGIEYATSGNTGGPAFPIIYSASKTIGFNAGYNQFNVYRYVKDSVKYYQVIRPYTELTMMFGLRNEQFFQGKFANVHKDMFAYGVEFTRMYSKGSYTNQRNNTNGFNLYGIYNSKNKHWSIQADLLFNSFKSQENGGVTISIFDSSFFQSKLAPVQLETAENNYRETNFYLTSSYIAGKKYKEYVDDSTSKEKLMPLFRISHQFNVESNKHRYRDRDSDKAPGFYNNLYNADSVFNDLDYIKIGNALMLEYKWRKLSSDTGYEEKNFMVNAEAGFDYYLMKQNRIGSNFSNLYVGGTVRNNSAAKSRIIYKGTVKYYLYGWNQNDFLVDGSVGYDFGKWGSITGNATYQLNEAPYIYERYTAHPGEWSYNLPKTRTLTFGGKYQNPKWGITAEANYYNLQNLPVYPGFANPYYDLKGGNFVVPHFANRTGIKGFHFDNDVWMTIPLGNSTITDYYAFLYTKHSVFYDARVFKKVLWLAIGVDLRMRYYTNPPYYDPLLGAFYPSFSNLKFMPQFDVFLNVKVKTVRIFLKLDNVLSSLGNYSLYQYPQADLSFKFGLRWRFFE